MLLVIARFAPVCKRRLTGVVSRVQRHSRSDEVFHRLKPRTDTSCKYLMEIIPALVIDGVEVQGLPSCDPTDPTTCNTPYRVQSPVFDRRVPAFDNLLIGEDGACYENRTGTGAPYTVHGAVADGVYVMIKPLPVGEHTIRFGLTDQATGEPNRLYRITVSTGEK